MIESDVNRRVRVFDNPNGNGLIGRVTAIFSATTFRFKTDPSDKYPEGREYEFSTEGELAVQVQFLDVVQ
jgi:hypothetical protein